MLKDTLFYLMKNFVLFSLLLLVSPEIKNNSKKVDEPGQAPLFIQQISINPFLCVRCCAKC